MAIRSGMGALRVKTALVLAKGAIRSWLRAVEEDVEWLANNSPLFEELTSHGDLKLTAYFNMCRIAPRQTAAATVKATQSPRVIQAAIADMAQQTVPAATHLPETDTEVHTCTVDGCFKEYREYNRLQMHMVAVKWTWVG